jgi:hypothetical protein
VSAHWQPKFVAYQDANLDPEVQEYSTVQAAAGAPAVLKAPVLRLMRMLLIMFTAKELDF